MSQIVEAIYTKLSSDSGITAIASTRIYPIKMPDNVAFPAVSFQQISGSRSYSNANDAKLSQVQIQVDSWAKTVSEVRGLAAAIRAALDTLVGTVSAVDIVGVFLDNEQDSYEEEVLVYRVIQEFTFHYNA